MLSDSKVPPMQLSDKAQARFNGYVRLAAVLLGTAPVALLIALGVSAAIERYRPEARRKREIEAHRARILREDQAARAEVMRRLANHGAREEPYGGKGQGLCLDFREWRGGNEDLADLPLLVECEHRFGLEALDIVATGDAFSDASLPHFVNFAWLYGSYSLDLTSSRVTDEGLSVLSGSNVTDLTLDDTAIGDEGMVHIPKRVCLLSLKRTRVTDAGLKLLERHDLWDVALDGCSITDAGLKWIRPHRQLSLADTLVKGPGLETLKDGGYHNRTLDLSGTQITDETIECLAGVEFLLCVLDRTPITDEGLRRLLRHESVPHSFRLADTAISPELATAIQSKLDRYTDSVRASELRQLLSASP